VARFHYRTESDVVGIIENCRRLGFNTVLFQVRGEATLAYRSELEPWLLEFGEESPGFDPLATAIRAARERGLRLEAWVNIAPGWFGKSPPRSTEHLYHTRPEWFLYDESGARQALSEHYVILNPCLPEVRTHIIGVIRELVQRYAVDGVHMDYVRYAWDLTPDAKNRFPYDPATLAAYGRATGRAPKDDLAAWAHWRGNQLTELVAGIRSMLAQAQPDTELTAAVWGDATAGYRDYLQNASGWLAAGLIDAAYPMAYRTDVDSFRRNIEAYHGASSGRVVPGIGVYRLDRDQQFIEQLEACRSWGGDFAVFSYESLMPTFRDRTRSKPDAVLEKQRGSRRSVLKSFCAEVADE
jgi:uncharacterized lipoprotein YddW (UPF0748 family)